MFGEFGGKRCVMRKWMGQGQVGKEGNGERERRRSEEIVRGEWRIAASSE